MALMSREHSYLVLIASSFLIGIIFRIFGNFQFKKEVLSILGMFQIVWFCGMDTIHFVVLITVGTIMIKTNCLGPRFVFTYCFIHRMVFVASTFIGFPRDENNLANATVFLSTIKMITVAYEVDDYRQTQKGTSLESTWKYRWLSLSEDPSAYDIICYMTCFPALLTGPIYRYRTYYDMLKTYINVPIREALQTKVLTILLLAVIFYLNPIRFETYKDGSLEKYSLFVRLILICIIVTLQLVKYSVTWLFSECVCVLIGIGAYPVSTKPSMGIGPTVLENGKLPANCKDFNFETISAVTLSNTLSSITVQDTLKSWNKTTQWWMGYFIYTSRIVPRHWRPLRALNVFLVSGLWHGIKPGYIISFGTMGVFLISEILFKKSVEDRINVDWALGKAMYKAFYWTFCKMFTMSFHFIIFMLQDYQAIARFVKMTGYYGFLVPGLFICFSGIFTFMLPKNDKKFD